VFNAVVEGDTVRTLQRRSLLRKLEWWVYNSIICMWHS